uniref:Uncharacterized protein n=1 Tax=Anguilla anguilla TaxID=7936 RepID=A0A0E9S9Z0_ANGAN
MCFFVSSCSSGTEHMLQSKGYIRMYVNYLKKFERPCIQKEKIVTFSDVNAHPRPVKPVSNDIKCFIKFRLCPSCTGMEIFKDCRHQQQSLRPLPL